MGDEPERRRGWWVGVALDQAAISKRPILVLLGESAPNEGRIEIGLYVDDLEELSALIARVLQETVKKGLESDADCTH